MPRLSLPLHTYALRSPTASPSRLVNCYAEQLPIDGRSPLYLSRAPGIGSWTTVGTGGIHAMHAALSLLFVVSGSKLYSVDSNKTVTELGSIGAPGNIDIDSNASSVVVVNEPNAYYWDQTTFGQITDADFTSRGAGDVEFVDNYLLFREPNSGRFFGSELGDETAYDALDFATAEGSPDEMVGMKVDHRQAVLFGEISTEIWQNTGVAGFPFERAINGFVEQGCASGRTVAKLDNSVFWVADDFTVRRLDGATPQRVSTHYIEQKISESTVTAASAFTYKQDGHLFYVLNLPEGTYVYDATPQLWHERETYSETGWDMKCTANFANKVLVGDQTSNKIGYLSPTVYDDFGSTQRMEWTYQPVFAENKRAFHHKLEIVTQPGVGLTTGQGSAATIMLEYSDDGGFTWTSMPNKTLGALGEYRNKAEWYRLGSSPQRVYRAAVSDPVRVVITDTFLEVTGGRI